MLSWVYKFFVPVECLAFKIKILNPFKRHSNPPNPFLRAEYCFLYDGLLYDASCQLDSQKLLGRVIILLLRYLFHSPKNGHITMLTSCY